MGGAMLLIAGVSDLALGVVKTSLLGNIAAPLFIALGASLLILELGRPFQAWRVFLNPKAILTIGAWTMLVAIGLGLFYASFGIQGMPWSNWIALRKFIALLLILSGLIMATYPGILLGRHKSRPFWTGPAMMMLFLLSSLITGLVAHILSSVILPPTSGDLTNSLKWLVVIFLGMQMLFWIGYLWVKYTGTTEREAIAAKKWIQGNSSYLFWIGFILMGSLLPIILLILPAKIYLVLGSVLALLGGALMRLMVIDSGKERTWLPGEIAYRTKLPTGTEEFLKAWNSE
jgi:formate-dependent nitrite reductase membrane component NrfD